MNIADNVTFLFVVSRRMIFEFAALDSGAIEAAGAVSLRRIHEQSAATKTHKEDRKYCKQ